MSNTYFIGTRSFAAEGPYLTLDMPDSAPLMGDGAALRGQLAKDGYLLIRGLHDPDAVLEARRDMLQQMTQRGMLDPAFPLMDGVVAPNAGIALTSSVRGNEYLKTPRVKDVVYSPRVIQFFATILGAEVLYYNFQWLRAVPPGAGSPIHCDIVYMGRGTKHLLTLWTPFGRVTPDMGPLAVCQNSHRWQSVIDTYGADDVDRHRTSGVFADDPAELVDRFGGRWVTTTFEPGDAVVLSMYNLHASLRNESNRFRISCDTRYQLASEPVDDRWAGPDPQGHDYMWSPGADSDPSKHRDDGGASERLPTRTKTK